MSAVRKVLDKQYLSGILIERKEVLIPVAQKKDEHFFCKADSNCVENSAVYIILEQYALILVFCLFQKIVCWWIELGNKRR